MHPLEQLLLIGLGTLLANWVAVRTRLTPVLWYLFMGAVLVNLGLLEREPGEFIEALAELGIIIIMFALGFEENTDHFLQSMKRSWGIALFGALAPFTAAYLLGLWYWNDQAAAVMAGLTMTATAVSLTLVSLRSEGLQRSNAATGIMTSALLDDLGSLVMVAIIVPIVTGDEPVTVQGVLFTVGKAALFFGVVVAVGMWLLPHEMHGRWVKKIPFVRSFGVRHLLSVGESGQATLVMTLLALGLALVGELFGLHAAVGAYMAGLILREEYFPDQTPEEGNTYRRAKVVIDDVAFVWIGPIFFFLLGGHLEFNLGLLQDSVLNASILFVTLATAQVLAAGLAARYTGGFDVRESVMIGVGMLGRAELAFVVLGIAHVQNDILGDEAFYTLMLTTFMLNVMVPVGISTWKPWFTGERALPDWLARLNRPASDA